MSPPVPPQKSSTRFIVKRPDEASAEPAKPWDVLRTGSTSTPVPNMKRCLLPCDTLSSSPQLTAQLLASSKELENGVTKIESHDYGQELLSALRQHKFEQDTAMAELRGHFEKRLKEMEGTLRSNVEIATTTASAVKDLSDRLLRLSESFEAYQSEGCSATDVLILQSQIMQTQRWITQLSERLGSGEEARQLGLTNGSERETQVNSIQDKGLSFLAEDDDEAQSTRVDSQDGASCGSGSREGGNDQHDLEQRISQIYREVERAFRVDVPDSMTTNGCDNSEDGTDSLSSGSNINMSMLSSYYTSNGLQHAREAQMRDACYDITEPTLHHPADNDPSSSGLQHAREAQMRVACYDITEPTLHHPADNDPSGSVAFLPSANFKRNTISTNCAPIPEEFADNGEDTNVNGQGEDTNGAMGG